MLTGLIIKGIGGFYYVKTADGVVSCRACGRFRKEHIAPLPGDTVRCEILPDGTGYVEEILPRKNVLIRPPVANLERMFIVFSAAGPMPNFYTVDKLTAVCEHKGIEPLIVVNKTDVGEEPPEAEQYRKAGFEVLTVSAKSGDGIAALREKIGGHICAFAGNSGVGKSSLVNAILGREQMEVGDISRKISRGKHTTRHVELIETDGGYLADTPGFGDIGSECFDVVYKEELADCFREFALFRERCRFTGCSHTKEIGCAVLQAVRDGEISAKRHESYCAMYDEVKDIKEWQR